MHEQMMKPVAYSQGVGIYCSSNGRLSFFNSPYVAHIGFSAVDIYPGCAYGEAAPSPVMGRVVKVRHVMCPKGRHFESTAFDCAVLLKSLENPDRLVKILHVKPYVEVGEVIEPGQKLGVLLRSGYFDFWTDPHIHVEIREPSDPLRARGGFKIERLIEIEENDPLEELRGTVVEARPEYALISLDNAVEVGLPADIDGDMAILDAGIPHYGWIGAHTNGEPPIGADVKLCGKKIGTIESVHRNMCLAKCSDFDLRLRGVQVGLSLFLNLSSNPSMKIVPSKPGKLKVERSEEVSLDIGHRSSYE